MIIPIAHDCCNMIIPKSNSTHEFTNKVDKLRALPSHVLGATRFHVMSCYETLDSTLLDLLFEPTFVMSLSFPELLLLGGVILTTVVESGFLGGTTVVESSSKQFRPRTTTTMVSAENNTSGPVLEKVGEVAYKLELPEELSRVHNTFHVSNLKKCHADEPLAVPLDGLHLDDKLHFVEEPLEIVGREVKRLKRSRIPLVKVRWNSKRGPEFTWEREDQFKKKYPHLFTKTTPSSSAASSTGDDLKTYVIRFQELAVLCPNMVPNSEKLMEAFIGGLPQSIKGNVTASKPQTLEEATSIAHRLMD
ncbi:hypothetical protein Tco_1394040 [Tanacetum coccineum]